MQRSAWIFLAAILLPSLGLAWMAVHSVRDQQVVLEHQEAIISQNITDALARNIQGQMDQVQSDFVKTTQQLLNESPSPEALAQDFNRKLRDAWPVAEIGFAVNLNGEIYSPKAYDGPGARTFRDENDRFLSNRENAEVYSYNNPMSNLNSSMVQNTMMKMTAKQADLAAADLMNTKENQATPAGNGLPMNNDKGLNSGSRQARLQDKLQPVTEASLSGEQEKQKALSEADSAQLRDLNQLTMKVKAADTQTNADALAGQEDVVSRETDRSVANLSGAVAQAPAGAVAGAVQSNPGVPGRGDLDKKAAEVVKAPSATEATPAPVDAAAAVSATPQAQDALKDTEHAVYAAPASAAASGKVTLAGAITITAPPAGSVDAAAPAAASPPSPVMVMNPTAPGQAEASSIATGGMPEAKAQGGTGLPATNPLQNVAQTSLDGQNMATQQMVTSLRNVVPQQMPAKNIASISNTVPEQSDFRRVIGTETNGELARFLENKLRLMVWSHAPADAPIVFGAQLDQGKLVETLKDSFQIPEMTPDGSSHSNENNYCVAILDDAGHPVALSRPGFTGDWKHPFVATEIGEVLPHWEAALYLVDPQQIGRAARTLRLTLGLIVLVLVAAIVSGGWLIAADVRRQVRLAQQKTDFVSNVSHELKTPLTSIRMFADLLAEKRVPDEERKATYLRIIAAEAARLTRLINNVLDFARMERGAPPGEHQPCDLVDAVRDVIETCQPHLEAAGVAFRHEIEAETLPIHGDRDALAQIILNLASNAEKYGGNDVLVRVRRQETAAGALGCVDVLDRGPGIPAHEVKTIFEPFHRLDDSLSSGIPGSGLGLTLARRMARSHGGDVTYSARAGGGSCFTLSVPLVKAKSNL